MATARRAFSLHYERRRGARRASRNAPPWAAQRIRQARAEAARLAESLTSQWEGVVDAAASTGNDDEHDPEGPTIAYEREQLQAMRERVRGERTVLDLAAERLRDGVY